jgi:hypothetical protein
MRRSAAHVVVAVAGAWTLVSCSSSGCSVSDAHTLRQMSLSYCYEMTPSEAPPHARTDVLYKIVIMDHKTQQPIQGGEGTLFASNGAGARTWDALTYGPEVGVYHAKLNYVIAGTWAVAIRFRRDSLAPLERTDWMQDVLNERPTPNP